MAFLKDYRHIIFYGLILAILVFALKLLKWQFLVLDNAIEIYIGLIAVFFTVLGIWVAKQLFKPKEKTVIIEREVPEKITINETELKKLNLSKREYEVQRQTPKTNHQLPTPQPRPRCGLPAKQNHTHHPKHNIFALPRFTNKGHKPVIAIPGP